MISSLIRGTIVGGIILFTWGAISWMVIPWHQLEQFTDEMAVAQTIKANAPQAGVYMLPLKHDATTSRQPDYFFFGSVKLAAPESLNYKMLIDFLVQCIIAFVLSLILLVCHIRDYAQRLILLTLVGLSAGLFCYTPLWNWFEFSPLFTLVGIADHTIGAFLAGLALAHIIKK